MKKAIALTFLLALSIVTIILVQSVKAQDTSYPDVFPFNGVTIVSPSNGSVYNNNLLRLKVSSNVQADIFPPHGPYPPNATVSANYNLDGSLNESIPMQYQYVQFGVGLFTGSVNLPPLSEGSHTLVVFSKSEEFNVNTLGSYYPDFVVQDQRIVYFKVNLGIPPVISNLSIENKTYPTNTLTLNFTANNPTNNPTFWMGYKLDNQSIAALVENKTLTGLSNGEHSIVVYANDTFGNMGSQTINFTVDKPQMEILGNTFIITIIAVPAAIVCIAVGLLLFRRHRKTTNLT